MDTSGVLRRLVQRAPEVSSRTMIPRGGAARTTRILVIAGILGSGVGLGCDKPGLETSSDKNSTPEPSLPALPKCDDQVVVQFEDDEGLVRPGVRVADLLRAVSTPIPIRFEARQENQFLLVPSLDGVQGTVHVEYDGQLIRYEYWKQVGGRDEGVDESKTRSDCRDRLWIPANLKTRTQGGVLDESMSVFLDVRFDAGHAIDLNNLLVDVAIDPAQFRHFFDLFEMGPPALDPEDKVGEQHYEMFTAFVGGVPQGRIGAVQEVIPKEIEGVEPTPTEVSARFNIVPLP